LTLFFHSLQQGFAIAVLAANLELCVVFGKGNRPHGAAGLAELCFPYRERAGFQFFFFLIFFSAFSAF